MTRIPLFLFALALLVVGCGQSRSVESVAPATAATISGPGGEQEVLRSDVEEIVDAVSGSEQFVTAVFGSDSVPPEFRQTVVTQLIQVRALEELVADEGAEVTDEDRAEIQGLLEEELAGILSQGGGEADTEAVLAQIDPYTDLLIERNALLGALGRSLSGGAEPETQEVACARHILVQDRALADDLVSQLQGGADFAELAGEHSADPGSGAQGGDLGCSPPDRYVPEFAEAVSTAPLNEVVGPVETQFGFHLIEVYERRTEEIPTDTLTAAGAALNERLQALDVTVSADLGQWDPQALAVVDPDAAAGGASLVEDE